MRVSPDAPVDFTSESFQRRIEENLEDAPSAGSDGSTVDLSKLLLIAEDGEFVREAYRRILRREGDPGGLENYAQLLRGGTPRSTVLRQLAESGEGRATGLRYVGLASSTSAPRMPVTQRAHLWLMESIQHVLARLRAALRITSLEQKIDYLAAAENRAAKATEAVEASQARLKDELLARIEVLEAALARAEAARRPPVFHAGQNITVTEVDGFILGVPGEEWRLGAYYALRGLPEPGMLRLFASLLRPGMTFADVGAHIGIYSLTALRVLAGNGRVHAFEPSPRTFQILKDNIQVNGFLESGSVFLHPIAIAGEEGTAELTVYAANSGHNTLFGADTGGERVAVRTRTLDAVLAEEPRLDLVKIDAEGAEPGILRGMTKLFDRHPGVRVFFEFAPEHLRRAGVDPLQWVNDLTAGGFTLRRVEDVTGELLPVESEELVHCISWNLMLTRSAPGKPH
jgi:FkbM family methyltransferase